MALGSREEGRRGQRWVDGRTTLVSVCTARASARGAGTLEVDSLMSLGKHLSLCASMTWG